MKKSEETVSSENGTCTKKKCCGAWGKFWIIVGAIIIVVVGFYVWTAYKAQSGNPTQTAKATDQQVLAIIAKVQRHMVLPNNEVPQVAEIKDAALAAKEQPFLSGAQNGDVLIVYEAASKAIVYSPSRDLIVNVGPVQMSSAEQATPASNTTAPATKDTTTTPKKK